MPTGETVQNHVNSRAILAMVLPLALISCSTTPPVQRRWGSLVDQDNKTISHVKSEDTKPALWVGSFGADSPTVSIKDLPDHAAAAFIDNIGKMPKISLDSLRAGIAKKISSSKPNLDTTSLDRTLVITVSKQAYQPADRLVRTEVELTPTTDQKFVFSDFTAAATTYSSINIETLSATKTASSGMTLTPNFGTAVPIGAQFTAGNSQSYTDQASVTVQNEQLTVYKRDKALLVYRESERNIDLTGSTLVKLSLRVVDPEAVDYEWVVTDMKLFNDDGKLLHPNDATVSLKLGRYTKPKPINVNAKLRYLLRHVISGEETYNENDDKVKFVEGTLSCNFTIVPTDDLRVLRWQVVAKQPVGEQSPRPVKLIDATGDENSFSFLDYDDAAKFIHWRTHEGAGSIGEYQLVEQDEGGHYLPLPRTAELKLIVLGGPLKGSGEDNLTLPDECNRRLPQK